MFDSGMILKGKTRCQSLSGIKGSKDDDITYIPSCSRTPKTSVNWDRSEDILLGEEDTVYVTLLF